MSKKKHTIPKETKRWINLQLSKHLNDWGFKVDCRDAKKNILADICSLHTNYLIRQLSYKDSMKIEPCWDSIYAYIWTKLEREARRRIRGQFK